MLINLAITYGTKATKTCFLKLLVNQLIFAHIVSYNS